MSTTITSLLNSLHTQLQSQTQLLPGLHSQLGLPPTALADELSTLQQELTQCVEKQIDLRRKQVDEWMDKCTDVEEDCLRYGRALGNHVKAVGSSVGEIRKEQILPRRFERATEYQEKMRQMYHTKLEQLLTLTGRVAALARTLGSEYYSPDILEPTYASGESEVDPSSHRDVTPERFAKLEKELVRGKGEVTKRLAQLSGTMIQIDWLYTELGMAPPTLDDLTASSSASSSLAPPSRSGSSCSHRASNSSDPFLSTSVISSTPTPASRMKPVTPLLFFTHVEDPVPDTEYQRVFARFVARMEEASDEHLSDSNAVTIGLEGVDPTPGLIAWADSTRAELEDIKRKREAHIQAMYDQLEALWRRLGVEDADMDRFVEAHRGSTETTVREYEEELERMLELKRERMGVFVENARIEIIKLWDELMISEEEREDFAPFADDEHTEELLSIHEEEIRRLKEERRAKGPLLRDIKKYFDICDDEKELAAAASDQSRLLGRGPRDPGRLLREEKMRKRVTKEKPRLERELLISIPAWEAEAGRPFLVHGESILQLLMETASAADKENNSKRSKSGGRAGSVPLRATTPPNPPHHYMPKPNSSHGAGKANTPALRPGSSMSSSQSAPSKRAKLGESTNSIPPVPARTALGSSKGAGANRPPSPKLTVKTLTTSSSLPRPASMAAKTATASLGHGRVPTSHSHRSHAYHPYPAAQRAASQSSYRTYGGPAPALNNTAISRKASRARRESFKPRPSMDESWRVGVGSVDVAATRRWAGFSGGAVKEEEAY